MFVSGPRPVRVGKAGQEADGGEVGGGGGGVGLRGGAARRSGAASEVVVWACGVAAAARAAATAPGTAAVWCVPALRVPLVHSLINHFRQRKIEVPEERSF